MEMLYEEIINYGMEIHAQGKKILSDPRFESCFDADFPMFISADRDIFISLPLVSLQEIETFRREIPQTFSVVKTDGYSDEYGDTVEIYKHALVCKIGRVVGDKPENEIFYIMKEILVRTGAI